MNNKQTNKTKLLIEIVSAMTAWLGAFIAAFGLLFMYDYVLTYGWV